MDEIIHGTKPNIVDNVEGMVTSGEEEDADEESEDCGDGEKDASGEDCNGIPMERMRNHLVEKKPKREYC